MFDYYVLLDDIYNNTIVKVNGRMQYRYVYGYNDWVPTGILLVYYTEGSYFYEKYKKISEEEALQIIKETVVFYDKLKNIAIEEASKVVSKDQFLFNYVVKDGGFDDVTLNIICLLYYISINKGYDRQYFISLGFPFGIINSLDVLSKYQDVNSENVLELIRRDYGAKNIKLCELREKEKNELDNKEKYKRAIDFLEYK